MKNNKIVLFLPEFLGPSAFNLGPSALFFDHIGFDMPIFFQREVYKHFDEVGITVCKNNSFVENAFVIASRQYKIALETANKTKEQLKLLFDEKIFMQILTTHFILRSGHKSLISKTKSYYPMLSSQVENPAMLNVAVREFIWHIHELYLELNGNMQKIIKYVETDAKKYKCPLEYLASFICHRIIALEHNPVHILTNNRLMIDILADLGRSIESDIVQDQSFAKEEILSFRLFDIILQPFIPDLDRRNSKRLVRLRIEKNNALNVLKQYIKEIAIELFEIYGDKKSFKENRIRKAINSLKDTINETLELDKNALTRYFQGLLENKAIWIGILGLISTLVNGISPIIPASFGATALSAVGTEALKTRRLKKECLKANPTRFLYYLERTIK